MFLKYRTPLSAISIGLILSLCSLSLMAGQHEYGKEFATSQLSTTHDATQNPALKASDLYLANPPQTANFTSGVDLFSQGANRINNCKTTVAGTDKVANQECEAVNFLAKNPTARKRVDLSTTDPIFVTARDTMSNATDDPATAGECVDRTVTDPDEHRTEVCHQVIVNEPKSCTVGRVIKVDGDSNFQCNITYLSMESVKCDRRVNVVCPPAPAGCGPNGIMNTSASVSGFGRYVIHPTSDGYYFMSFGTVNTDGGFINNLFFDGSYYNVYTGNYTFNIDDPNRIATFFLDEILFDDNVAVWVNGTLVYHSQGGSDWLYLAPTGSFGGGSACKGPGYTNCSRGYFSGGSNITSIHGSEMKQLLKKGSNTVTMKLVVGRNGDGIVRFKTLLYCPRVCSHTEINECATLQQRAK